MDQLDPQEVQTCLAHLQEHLEECRIAIDRRDEDYVLYFPDKDEYPLERPAYDQATWNAAAHVFYSQPLEDIDALALLIKRQMTHSSDAREYAARAITMKASEDQRFEALGWCGAQDEDEQGAAESLGEAAGGAFRTHCKATVISAIRMSPDQPHSAAIFIDAVLGEDRAVIREAMDLCIKAGVNHGDIALGCLNFQVCYQGPQKTCLVLDALTDLASQATTADAMEMVRAVKSWSFPEITDWPPDEDRVKGAIAKFEHSVMNILKLRAQAPMGQPVFSAP